MKNLRFIALFLGLVFVGGVAYAGNQPDYESYQEKANATQKKGVPVRTLKLVRNGAASPNASTISVDSVVIYDTTSDDGVTVTMTTTSLDGAIAGVVASGSNIPTSDATSGTTASDDAGRRNWGWIVVHGPATAKAIAGGTNGHSVGDSFFTSTDAGAVTTMGPLSNASASFDGTALTARMKRRNGGFFMDAADGTSTTYDVFVTAE